MILVINKRSDMWTPVHENLVKKFYNMLDEKEMKIPYVEIDVKSASKDIVYQALQDSINKVLPYNEKDFVVHRNKIFYKRYLQAKKKENDFRIRMEGIKKDFERKFEQERRETEERLAEKQNLFEERIQALELEKENLFREIKIQYEEMRSLQEKESQNFTQELQICRKEIALLQAKLAEQTPIQKESFENLDSNQIKIKEEKSQEKPNEIEDEKQEISLPIVPIIHKNSLSNESHAKPQTLIKPEQNHVNSSKLKKMNEDIQKTWNDVYSVELKEDSLIFSVSKLDWADDTTLKKLNEDMKLSMRQNNIEEYKKLIAYLYKLQWRGPPADLNLMSLSSIITALTIAKQINLDLKLLEKLTLNFNLGDLNVRCDTYYQVKELLSFIPTCSTS